MAKCHPEFWGGIFGNFEERIEGLQNSGWWLLFLLTAIFLSTATPKTLFRVAKHFSFYIRMRRGTAAARGAAGSGAGQA